MVSVISFEEPYCEIGTAGASSRNLCLIAVNCGGGRKDEVFDATIHRAFDERSRVNSIIAIIDQWVADRIRNDERGSEMQDGPNAVFSDQTRNQDLIAGISHNDRDALRNRLSKPGRKIIKDDDLLSRISKWGL